MPACHHRLGDDRRVTLCAGCGDYRLCHLCERWRPDGEFRRGRDGWALGKCAECDRIDSNVRSAKLVARQIAAGLCSTKGCQEPVAPGRKKCHRHARMATAASLRYQAKHRR